MKTPDYRNREDADENNGRDSCYTGAVFLEDAKRGR